MIKTYKIVCAKYDTKVAPILAQTRLTGMCVTRDNILRLLKSLKLVLNTICTSRVVFVGGGEPGNFPVTGSYVPIPPTAGLSEN